VKSMKHLKGGASYKSLGTSDLDPSSGHFIASHVAVSFVFDLWPPCENRGFPTRNRQWGFPTYSLSHTKTDLHFKSPLLLSDLLKTVGCRQILVKLPNVKFHKYSFISFRVTCVKKGDGRTDLF
jgi:hypothetical protein